MTNPHRFSEGKVPYKNKCENPYSAAQFWLDSMASRAWNTVPIFSTWLSSVTQTSVPKALLRRLQPWPSACSLLSVSYHIAAS